MRSLLCKFCGGFHDLDAPWPDNCLPERVMTRADLPAPHVIGDSMEPVMSMLDGKMYDSKSRMRAPYRSAGVIEAGNDPAIFKPAPQPRGKTRQEREKLRFDIRKGFSRAGLGALT